LFPVVAAALAIAGGILLMTYLSPQMQATSAPDSLISHPAATASRMPMDVEQVFKDRERGGDALGPNYLEMDGSFVDDENHCEFCIAVEYKPGPHGKAVVALRNNEPIDLTAAKALTFIARGENGGEVIRVYAAGARNEGLDGLPAPDDALRGVRYAVAGNVTLDRQWQKYELNLEGLELSEVTHAFAFEVMKGKGNEARTVYLDAIFYQSDSGSPDSVALN
jgi:hypothetical protein